MEPFTTTNDFETITKGSWQWQSNPDPWLKNEPPKWESYSLDHNYLIEKAYYDQQKEVDLGDYLIYPLEFLQKKKGNLQAQRPIRRINWMDDEEMQNRSARYCESELPKTINRIFGGLGDFISFFSRRNGEILDFTNLFKELEKSNDLDILNHKITPKLVNCLEEVLLKPIEEKLNDSSITPFKKKTVIKAKGKIEELISAFKKPFASFEDFYGQVLRAYTMNTDLYPDLNKYLRDESWVEIDKLLPYAFCLCKAFFHLKPKPSLMKAEEEKISESHNSKKITSTILYRGTAFDEFALSFYDQTKIQYFSWNAVTSTTTNKKVAEEFMLNSADLEKKKYPVLFTIEVPDKMESEEYLKWLDICQYSAMPKEDEVILAPGSVFELVEVFTDQDKKSTIKIKLKNEVQSLAHKGLMMQGTLQSQMTTAKEAKLMCLDGEELSQALTSLHGNQLIEEVEFCLCLFDEILLKKMFHILPTVVKLKTLKFISCIYEGIREIATEKLQSSGVTKIEIIEVNDFFLMICNENLNQVYWKSLKELDLDFRSRRSLPDQHLSHKVSQGLKYLPQLRALNINFEHCSFLTNEGVNTLAKGLDSMTQLVHLNINFNFCTKITDKGVNSLTKSLDCLTQLAYLCLSFQCCPKITDMGVDSLAKILSSLTHLVDLSLNFQACPQITFQGVNILVFQGLKPLSQLKSLDIDFNLVEDPKLISQGLRNFTELTSLALGNLVYGDEELNSFVSDGLKHLIHLQSLTLIFFGKANREITDEGLEFFASQGLKSLTSLTSLDLGFSGFEEITDQGVENLACHGLQHLIKLKSLVIGFSSCYQITEEGISSLMSQGIKSLAQLESLTLDFTMCDEITNRGMEILASKWLRNLPIFESLTVKNQTLQNIDTQTQEQLKNSPRVSLARESSQKGKQSFDKEFPVSLSEDCNFKVASNSSESFSQDLLEKLISVFKKDEDMASDLHSAPKDLEIFAKIHCLTSLTLKFETYQSAMTDRLLHILASQVLKHCPQLKSLALDFYDCYQITDKGVSNLALCGLKSFTSLTSLTLNFGSSFSCSQITDKGMLFLASEGLMYLSQLKSLNLTFSKCQNITEKGVSDLALYGLKPLVNLACFKLHFSSCSEITDQAMFVLASKGLTHLSQLKALALRFTGCSRITDKGMSDLVLYGLKPLTDLTSIDLDFSYYNQITDEGMINLAREGLRHLSKLKSLSLSFTECDGITDKGWVDLAQNGLGYLPQLESLVLLSNSKITDEGVRDLVSYGLKPLTNLLSLNLDISSDQITDKGMIGLASEGLIHLSQLKSLNLNFSGCSGIKDEGCIYLAWNGLRHLSQLESLVLKLGSGIRDKEVDSLVSQGLKYLTQLESLSIGFAISEITDQGVNHLILQVIKNLPQLASLDLDFIQTRNISDFKIQNIIKVLHYFGFTKEIVAN